MHEYDHKASALTDFWYRIGSHRYEFFATNDEIQQFLLKELPDKFAPYSLVTTSGKVVREVMLDQLQQLIADRHLNIFLRSHQLTPDLDKAMKQFRRQRPDDYEFQLGFAGLILIQPGVLAPGGFDLSLVDKLRLEPSGQIINQLAYRPLFNQMKRLIRKKLVVWAVYDSGAAKQEWKKPMLTEGFAASIRAGKVHSKLVIVDK